MNIDQLTPGTDIEALQLKEHIASGAKSEWCVYVDSNAQSPSSFRYDNFSEANAKFDEVEPVQSASLVLFTRIGTAVVFRYKEPERTA